MQKPVLAVGALVQEPSGKFLIVQTTKWRGLWGVPGGKVEYAESAEAALKREFLEEVGLELTGIAFAQWQEAILSPEFVQPAHFLLLDFFAYTQQTRITPNPEIVQHAWVSLPEALTYPLNTYTTTLIYKAEQYPW